MRMVHVFDYLSNICHVWNHFYNTEIKNSKSSLFFLYTHLFAGKILEHSPGSWVTEREYVWSEGFSDSLYLGQVIFKTGMSLERSL